jgi:hypothetical protein
MARMPTPPIPPPGGDPDASPDAMSPTVMLQKRLQSMGLPLTAENMSRLLASNANFNSGGAGDGPVPGLRSDIPATEAEDQAAMRARGNGSPRSSAPPPYVNPPAVNLGAAPMTNEADFQMPTTPPIPNVGNLPFQAVPPPTTLPLPQIPPPILPGGGGGRGVVPAPNVPPAPPPPAAMQAPVPPPIPNPLETALNRAVPPAPPALPAPTPPLALPAPNAPTMPRIAAPPPVPQVGGPPPRLALPAPENTGAPRLPAPEPSLGERILRGLKETGGVRGAIPGAGGPRGGGMRGAPGIAGLGAGAAGLLDWYHELRRQQGQPPGS